MSGGFFAGSAAAPLAPTTRLECRICWHVYDPGRGDDVWQIPPGTPFADLPAHWACPTCGGRREDFIVMEDGA